MAEHKSDQEKTEKATPKKRQDARKKGQVAKSQELASVAVLSASLVVFYFGSYDMLEKMLEASKSNKITRDKWFEMATKRRDQTDVTPKKEDTSE